MARTKEECLREIAQTGVVAVIRARSAEQLPQVARALLAGGVKSIEVTMTTPDAIRGIARLAGELEEDAIVGVGTVLNAATARDAIAAGAQFVVSPGFDEQTVSATISAGKISIPGAFTPTEILRAWNAGADVVKVFPSTMLGPGYFKDVLAPLPHLRLTPTGGVDLSNAAAWIAAGAVFVGAGSALVTKQAMTNGDWAAITANAKAFVEVIRKARNS